MQFSPRHFVVIWTAAGVKMHEQAEMLLHTAIISNGVVEEKSVVVAR
jgi:hypothetical protein